MNRLLSKRSIVLMLVSLPIAAVILGIMACLPVPVGDPETSKVDPKFTGAWVYSNDGKKTLYVVSPYDSRTFLVRFFEYKEADGNVEAGRAGVFKAWLTSLAGHTFVTMEPQPIAQTLGWEPKPAPGPDAEIRYVVGKLAVVDSKLELNAIKGFEAPFKDVKTREQAETIIKDRINDPEIYMKETMKFEKLDAEKAKPILEAFHTE